VYLTMWQSALSSDHLPVLIDTRCQLSFLNDPDCPDFRKTNWVKFQACLEDRLSPPPNLRNGLEIDTCVHEVYSANTEALAVSAASRRHRDDPRPRIPAHIQDISLKSRLGRQWQITRDPAVKAEINRLQRSVTHQLNEWRNEQWSDTLESFDPEDLEASPS
jgi:hypothetical protein